MDFIVQLPQSAQGNDAIMVVVDKLTKRVHFVPTTTEASAEETAELFFERVISQHGLPKVIISDRDSKFISHFWKKLFQLMGTTLKFSTAYHPQTDGQTERMNRVLEEMLRGFINHPQDNWEKLLPAVEFAYNSSVQASTGQTPFFFSSGG